MCCVGVGEEHFEKLKIALMHTFYAAGISARELLGVSTSLCACECNFVRTDMYASMHVCMQHGCVCVCVCVCVHVCSCMHASMLACTIPCTCAFKVCVRMLPIHIGVSHDHSGAGSEDTRTISLPHAHTISPFHSGFRPFFEHVGGMDEEKHAEHTDAHDRVGVHFTITIPTRHVADHGPDVPH